MESHPSEIIRRQSGLLRTENGFTFRDLNKNGKLDVYEDPRKQKLDVPHDSENPLYPFGFGLTY